MAVGEWNSRRQRTFSLLLEDADDGADDGIGGAGPLIEVLTAAKGCPEPEEFWALWSSGTRTGGSFRSDLTDIGIINIIWCLPTMKDVLLLPQKLMRRIGYHSLCESLKPQRTSKEEREKPLGSKDDRSGCKIWAEFVQTRIGCSASKNVLRVIPVLEQKKTDQNLTQWWHLSFKIWASY